MKHGIAAIVALVLLGCGFLFVNTYWTPAVHSVKEEDFSSYSSYILVRETFHTGTKWEIIGDEAGRYEIEAIRDVVLAGDQLPYCKIGQYVNTFLCVVQYEGTVDHVAFEIPVDSYKITEWHPVYPVVRNGLWPDWMLPSEFMNEGDLESY